MSNLSTIKKRAVGYFLSRGILLSPDVLEQLKEETDINSVCELLRQQVSSEEFCLLTKEISGLLEQHADLREINWLDLEKSRVRYDRQEDTQQYSQFIDHLKHETQSADSQEQVADGVSVLFNYDKEQDKKDVRDFVTYFNQRFKALEKILSQRQELSHLLPIYRVKQKKERETISLIGMVTEKQTTKNGNLMITMEDSRASIKVLINKNKPEMYEEALDIVEDEVLGINGVADNNIVFANSVVWPDVPHTKELKKAPEESYAVFLSDLHVGSHEFLGQDFQRFLSWLNGEVGNSTQQHIASRVKYIFITGDLIDGIGIYPGQEEDLDITDVYEQYKKCAEYLRMIPSHIPIIVSPGNHDAMRLSEPQPALYKDYAEAVWALPNVHMVSNPAVVNIGAGDGFGGFDILLYHGYSFDHFAQNVHSVRSNGGYDRSDLLMRFLLKRRHLAPTHTSTLYIPSKESDPLVIDPIPDFFVSGHIHKCSVGAYRNITTICGSCWQAQTAFQEKVGLVPEPSKVPLVNLQTRDVKVLKFGEQ